MICLGDCLCLRGSPTRCEVTISEDVSATPTDDVTSRSFSVVDSSGVSGIPETRMSDRRSYCSSSSNCRRRFFVFLAQKVDIGPYWFYHLLD